MTGATEDREARTAILQGFERLLQEQAFDDISVADILPASGISRATFYFYFASKDDAFLALLDEFTGALVTRFEEILGDVERRRSPDLLRQDIAAWLTIAPPDSVIGRTAIEEWPRRPELRHGFVAAQSRMAQALGKAIDADRRAGVAVKSIPSAQLASGWIWTMERAWYESIGGAEHLDDIPAVNDALAATLVAAIYGGS
jgi:AcrR family transcriptional regulator